MRGINRQLYDIESISQHLLAAPLSIGISAIAHVPLRGARTQLVPRPLRTRPDPRAYAPGRRSPKHSCRVAGAQRRVRTAEAQVPPRPAPRPSGRRLGTAHVRAYPLPPGRRRRGALISDSPSLTASLRILTLSSERVRHSRSELSTSFTTPAQHCDDRTIVNLCSIN
ncbi:unnamed protein product [Leptosia nina]|uniref:Uncharacterized protein n=1 Tax=Leptosia nina TaxID=320188 RepID=A0AAV1JK55_9NEOP